MIRFFNLKNVVFLLICLYSSVLSAQINSTTAVVPFGSNPSYGFGIMPTNLPSGGTYGKSQDAADAYNEWKSNYTESCGSGMIRVKFDEPNRTVSEGIGYGMHLSVYAADKALFDGLYKYWKNFQSGSSSGKPGKLMNWRIDGCSGVSGTGSAADADVDVAFALIIADNQWPTSTSPYDYSVEADNILKSIKELEVNGQGQLINGDSWGFGDNCRNPGYQSPAYYTFFAPANPSYGNFWTTTARSGAYALINSNADSNTGLISDWSTPQGNRNTCNPGGLGYAATDGYGYDAARFPWRMAQDVIWSNDATAKALCVKMAAYINTKGAGGIGGPLYQNGNNYAGFSHNATFVSTFAMAVMGSTNQSLMNSMYTETKNTKDVIKNTTLSGYFGNTLRCMSLFMMSGNYWKPGTTSIQEINIRQAAVNIPTGTSYDFQNQQISPPAATGKAVTFTIENLGFSTLNLTGAPKVAVTGLNASLFTVAQPSANSLALATSTTFVVTFTPTTTGTKTATLTIASNDPDEGSYVINLTGTGTPNATAAKMTVYDTLNILTSGSAFPMGAFTSGATGSKILKITNTGDSPLNITSATFSNTAFSLISPATLPLVIPIGGTGYLTIGYLAPLTPATSSSTITLATTDPNASTFILNATATSAACSANPTNKMMLDYDGNINLKLAFAPKGAFLPSAINPSKTGLNLSPTVASYVRPNAGTTTPAWDGNYDIIRYYNCGTTAGAAHAGSTYVPFAISTSNPAIQILFYSPAVGVTITLAPQKPSGTNAWAPLIADYSSNITVTTTKANQWELLTFDMSKSIPYAADFKSLDFQIDPLRAYAATKPAVADRTFYIDEIKYGINPCISDLSGILQDFDAHNNVSLDYAVASLSAPVLNPVSGGINTSANVGKFTKTKNAAAFDDGFRYNGCSNKIDFSTKKYLSMLVYAPVANAPIQISAKVPDGADLDTYPDDAVASTQSTVFANKWHRLYFDLSAISAINLPNVFGIDIFFDPSDITAGGNFYFDDIRLETALPCVAGIPATDILNDFENNRYLDVKFPGAAAFNTIKANPAPTGINTSAIVGEFIRGVGTVGTSVRFGACQNQLDLAAGHNIIELKMYSPNAGTAVTLSLKALNGTTELINVTDTIKAANTWTNLRFDVSNLLNATNVASIDVIVDPNATFSATGSTVAARTYLFDDLKYAAASPEINVKALTTPTTTDIPSTGSINLGTAAVGDSTDALNFSIQNNGLQTLLLSGTPAIKLGGANPADFVVTTTSSFNTSVSALGATGFTVTFKPTAGGPRSASITIVNNDANENPYVIYLNGTATTPSVPVISVFDGLTPVAHNNTTAVAIGAATKGTPAPAYTLKITNTGTAPLTVTSITGVPGFVPSAGITPVGPIAVGASATFTVVGTPAAVGPNLGSVTIVTNDLVTPSYKVNLSVIGLSGVIVVKDKALAPVVNDNPTVISMGSALVGSAATPTYTFTISNTGTGALTVATITSSSPVFAATSITPTGPIAPNGTATFTVTATPSITGTNTGVLTITTNDAVTPTFLVNVSVTGTAPALKVLDGVATVLNNNTPSINVGTSTVGVAAAPYTTFSISNTGTGPLTLTSITGSTGFPVSLVTPAAPTTIAAGASATFTVIATPTLVGANPGEITIVTNDPTTPSFTIKVTATGTATTPKLTVKDGTTVLTTDATPAINVGTAATGSPAAAYTSLSITNTGTAPLTLTSITASPIANFSITGATPGPIAPNATVTFTVIGTPTADGPNTGTITIATNDPTTNAFVINVVVTGTSVPTPVIKVQDGLTPLVSEVTVVDVGSAFVNSPAPAYTTLSITNVGTGPLTLTSIAGSTGFDVSAITPVLPATIAVNGTATFTVIATPTLVGLNTGTIKIATNDEATPIFTVNVTVTGNALLPILNVLNGSTPLITDGTAINVGTAPLGLPAAPFTAFTISNTGNGPLTITSITSTTGFDVTNIPTTVAANSTASFTVTATPSTIGDNPGKITIVTNDQTAGSFVINVVSTGISSSPVLEVYTSANVLVQSSNTPAVSVGDALIGSPAPEYTFTIKNTGNVELTGLDVATTSTGFTVGVPSSSTIAVGGDVTFTVTGTPSTALTLGVINISSANAPAYVVNVSVTGTSLATPMIEVLNGASPIANSNTTAILVGTAVIGNPATPYTLLSIKNTGGAALTINDIQASAGFVVTDITPSLPATIAANGTATFTVTATPAAAGLNTGTITITSDDPTAGIFVINVTANGTATATPAIQVLNGASPVANNNTTAILVGAAALGDPATAYTSFSIKNTGGAALTINGIAGSAGFDITGITPSLPAIIAANGTATFTVTGTPAVEGLNTGTITITSDDPTTAMFEINVTVNGLSAPQAIITVPGVTNNGPAIALGEAVVGSSTPIKTFTISNTGTLPLTVGTIISTNPDFVVTQVSPNPIPAGQTGTFTVVATPSAIGTSTGVIKIPSNDPSMPSFDINVSATGKGQGTGAVLEVVGKSNQLVPNNSTFIIGSNAINTPTLPYALTLKNVGTTDLLIKSVSTLNGFTVLTDVSNVILAPGTSIPIEVIGIPTNATATTMGLLVIKTDDASSPYIINVGVKVGTPTGVATALSSSAIELYPNPSEGNTNLAFNGTFDLVKVTIYMADGSKVYTAELATMSDTTTELQVAELPAGVYIVEISSAQGKLIKRFIKY